MKVGDIVQYIGGQDHKAKAIHSLEENKNYTITSLGIRYFEGIAKEAIEIDNKPIWFTKEIFKVMHKFQKGDKVKFPKTKSYGKPYEDWLYDAPKKSFYEIGCVFSDYINLFGGGNFLASDLEPYEDRKIIGYIAPYDVNHTIPKGTKLFLNPEESTEDKYVVEGKLHRGGQYALAKSFVESHFTPIYEELKPKEIVITLAHNATKVVVMKNKISVNEDKEIFTIDSIIFVKQVFGKWSTLVGNNGHSVSVSIVKVGCTYVTKEEFEQIEKAWKELNS